MSIDLAEALIATQALRIAPPGELFWYTSGTLGPYYINTHYLFGGPEAAEELLAFIQSDKEDRLGFPHRLRQRVRAQYDTDAVYRAVVDLLVERVGQVGAADPDLISGGERRDWFFSTAISLVLDRPHLLLYKDMSLVLDSGAAVTPLESLGDRRCVHAADLVTEASSYTGAWIPAIRRAGGEMALSVNVVDRGQGGIGAIQHAGVPAEALISVDDGLFGRLRSAGMVDAAQHDLLCAYFADPPTAMKVFLERDPSFLKASLRSGDSKTAARARLLVERNPYDLSPDLLA
jgi:orotate phosphoribosyltransferase